MRRCAPVRSRGRSRAREGAAHGIGGGQFAVHGQAGQPPVRVAARQTGNSSQMPASMSPLSDPIVIAPEGELDIGRLDEFRAALYDAARRAEQLLVVDLSHVEYIDSSSLGALVELHHRLRREKLRLAVV